MAYFIINGGGVLNGSIKVNSCKNSTVAILCATTMIKGETTIINVPIIEEVKRIIEVLISIGLKITWEEEHKLKIINDKKIKLENLNRESFIETRSGLLLLGSLCSTKNNFSLPKAGGCKLGKRTINPHILSLAHLGIKVTETIDSYIVTKENPKGSEFVMYESGDTATENAIMAASLIKGKTIIHFASSNYMVKDLCYFLKQAGAKIDGLDSFKIVVEGTEKLKPVNNYSIMPDPIEAMTIISIAITTKSNLKNNWLSG